ncbi:MAG TPA: YdcF family protein, partial [Brevundimonas sp.]|nr:YdcF family protein [Brevundimonas sp.]
MRFLALFGILALVWLVGLFAFADRVRSYSPADDPARADGIVVLTGPSSTR